MQDLSGGFLESLLLQLLSKMHVAVNGATGAGNSTECTGSLGNSQAEHTYIGSR